MKSYRLRVRTTGKVERERYEDRNQALAALERRGLALERTAGSRAVGGKLLRRYEPVQQVVGRIEISGPEGIQGGVDVRGDGSSEAFTGAACWHHERSMSEKWRVPLPPGA